MSEEKYTHYELVFGYHFKMLVNEFIEEKKRRNGVFYANALKKYGSETDTRILIILREIILHTWIDNKDLYFKLFFIIPICEIKVTARLMHYKNIKKQNIWLKLHFL